MTRPKSSRGFKVEAVRLVRYEEDQELIRGSIPRPMEAVAVAQAARDLDVAERVLRRRMWELGATPTAVYPGNGQMRADLAEIAALEK